MSSLSAYWTLSSPRTPIPRAIAAVYLRTSLMCAVPSVIGGRTQDESPEWIPASSMCYMTPPMYTSPVASHSASTSISTASSMNRSTSTGCSGLIAVARAM